MLTICSVRRYNLPNTENNYSNKFLHLAAATNGVSGAKTNGGTIPS